MMLRRVVWCVFLASLVVFATPPSESGPRRPRKRPFALRAHPVDFDSEAPHRRRHRRRYHAYETQSIEFDIYQRGRTGIERPKQVKLYLPNGDLYTTVDVVPFDDATVRQRRRPRATARLPVSGTAITRYGLYGEWRAEVCWETGSTMSCRRALTFILR